MDASEQMRRLLADQTRDITNRAASSKSHTTEEEKIAHGLSILQGQIALPTTMALLQATPPRGQAQCAAHYCLNAVNPEVASKAIEYHYRIALSSTTSTRMKYYHVPCIEAMVDPIELFPRFKLDPKGYAWMDGWPYQFGLMVRKWFENQGFINLDKIKEYIDTAKKFEDARKNGMKLKEYQEQRPILQDYKTSPDSTCTITEVLQHAYVEKMASSIVIHR